MSSSYAALDLAGRVTSAQGRARHLWLSGGAATMGIGIWSMHYVGMLAFRLPVPIEYDWHNVALSFLAAIFFASVIASVLVSTFLAIIISLVALVLTFRFRSDTISWSWRKCASALVMGSAISVMHYSGMAAASFTPSTRASGRSFPRLKH